MCWAKCQVRAGFCGALFLRVWDFAKTFVVVIRVIPGVWVLLRASADHNPALAPMTNAWRIHRVLPIETAVLPGQDPLVIAEVRAVVPWVLEGTAGENIVDNLMCLIR